MKQYTEEMFEEWVEAVYENEIVGLNQFVQLRRAFYSGVLRMLLTSMKKSPGFMENHDFIKAIEDEQERFSKDLDTMHEREHYYQYKEKIEKEML